MANLSRPAQLSYYIVTALSPAYGTDTQARLV